jgi:hypothetical protein
MLMAPEHRVCSGTGLPRASTRLLPRSRKGLLVSTRQRTVCRGVQVPCVNCEDKADHQNDQQGQGRAVELLSTAHQLAVVQLKSSMLVVSDSGRRFRSSASAVCGECPQAATEAQFTPHVGVTGLRTRDPARDAPTALTGGPGMHKTPPGDTARARRGLLLLLSRGGSRSAAAESSNRAVCRQSAVGPGVHTSQGGAVSPFWAVSCVVTTCNT